LFYEEQKGDESVDDLERELKVGFLDEAAQLLEDAEQFFLQLESSPDDPEIISAIFRVAHNLKGSGRAVGFSEMAEFTHVFESLLLKIKNLELKASTPIVNLLLRCSDHLKNWVDLLKADLNTSVDSSALVTELNTWLNGQAVDTPAEAPAEPVLSESAGNENHEVAQEVTEATAENSAGWSLPYPPADAFGEPEITQELKSDQVTALEAAPAVIASPVPVPVPMPVETAPSKPAAKADAKPAPQSEDESVRVSLRRLEALINNVGELVILQTVLNQHRHLIQSTLVQKTVSQLAKITKDIQDISMGLRMIPLKQTFQKMQRIVRDTSKVLGKEIEFEITGEQTELDKTVVDQLGDPLTHLIRNSVDHGVESPEGRQAVGKPLKGHVKLAAYHRGGQIVIEVSDDGKGLDAKKLIEKAIEKGLLKPGATMSDKEAHQLIFAPGFSTKQEVSEVSGRGVGMDVVKTNIEKKLQGEVELETVLGKGTTIRIMLPLTLAIIDGMVVRVAEEKYIVPLGHVFETLQPEDQDVHFVTGMGEVLNIRGEQIPLYRLGYALGRKQELKPASQAIALVVRTAEKPFAFLVDDILGQQQIVIKQLGLELRNLRGITGGAILGDGRAALILDLNELAGRVGAQAPIARVANASVEGRV
jgi:two-component system chemotaxis sensor kinase CheA